MANKDIAMAFSRIENELMHSMMRNLERHKAEETKEGFEWNQWQVEQLAALQKYKEHAAEKYGVEFSSINEQIKVALKNAYASGGNEEEIKMLEAMLKGADIKRSGEFFTPSSTNLDALVNSISNDFSKAEYALLRRSNDIYRQTILDAQFYSASGAATYEKAVDMATRDFLRKGIDCIQYKGGRRVNISTYAEMAIRTGNKRAALMGQGDKRKEWGHSLVKINKRGNPCHLCAPFVGKVMIDDVYSGGKASDGPYPLLSSGISQGLYHPNCKDSHSTYFPELDDLEDDLYTKNELKEIQDNVSMEQKLNYCDRKIEEFSRKEKYFLDPENKRIAGVRKSEWENRKRELLTQEKILNFNPVVVDDEGYQDFANYCNHLCTPREIKLINRHRTVRGIGGYFQTPNSFKLNRAIRENKVHLLNADDRNVIKVLGDVVSRVQTKEDYTLHRFDEPGILTHYFKIPVKDLVNNPKLIGKEISIDGFFSTSMIRDKNLFKSRPVEWGIKAPKGSNLFANGVLMESEAVISDKSTLRILNITNKNAKIFVEAILLS